MIQLPFQPRFVDPILSGAKVQTIRQTPKRGVKPGDTLRAFQWLGVPYRSKQWEIGRYEIVSCEAVAISTGKVSYPPHRFSIKSDGNLNVFAQRDGLASYGELTQFLVSAYGPLPFVGVLIKWNHRAACLATPSIAAQSSACHGNVAVPLETEFA